MLPELILKEERDDNFALLFVLGVASAGIGFLAANFLFPSQVAVLSVVFASIPLVYPLATKFLEDEDKGPGYFVEEIKIYGSLFAGEALAFTMIGLVKPSVLSLQASVAGISGRATAPGLFQSVLLNNLTVFAGILAVSAVIGSAGAFILVWNASVLGRFFAGLLSRLNGLEVLTGSSQVATPVAYIPHATLEMTGFIIAGISGSLVSAAVYREHFDRDTWVYLVKLVLLGVACILAGALLETA
jgi:uncharacterized membrane protein SpoIIM required for sporulation